MLDGHNHVEFNIFYFFKLFKIMYVSITLPCEHYDNKLTKNIRPTDIW